MQILLYASTKYLDGLVVSVNVLVSGAAVFRCISDLMQAYEKEDGLKAAFGKVKNRMFRTIIVICASSLVSVIGTYYA